MSQAMIGRRDSPEQFAEDEGKFRELMLLIIEKSQDDPGFGSTKLNKLLFAIDLFSYGITGEPITGFRYVKRQYGPAPAKLPQVRRKMIAEQELALQDVRSFGYTQKRPMALRPSDVRRFSAPEMALIDNVIRVFRGANASQISEWSHGLCGWAIAEKDTDIPYEVVFLSDKRMTAYEAERGRQLALERGWDVF